jgi:hypothetical protein
MTLLRWRAAVALAGLIVLVVCISAARDNVLSIVAVVGVGANQTATANIAQLDTKVAPIVVMIICTLSSLLQMIEYRGIVTPERARIIRICEWVATMPIMIVLVSALAGARDIWTLVLQATAAVVIAGIGAVSKGDQILFAISLYVMIASSMAVVWHVANASVPGYVHWVSGLYVTAAIFVPMIPPCSVLGAWPSDEIERVYLATGFVLRHVLSFWIVIGTRGYIDSL